MALKVLEKYHTTIQAPDVAGVQAPGMSLDEYASEAAQLQAIKDAWAKAQDDVSRRSSLVADLRLEIDLFITAALQKNRKREALEQAEWFHGCAMRDLLGSRTSAQLKARLSRDTVKLEQIRKELEDQAQTGRASSPATESRSFNDPRPGHKGKSAGATDRLHRRDEAGNPLGGNHKTAHG